MLRFYFLLLPLAVASTWSSAQYCGSITPFFAANLTASPNATWTSPDTNRIGHCCGTTSPDKCVEFEITLHPSSVGIIFDISSGAVPPGALFYQINCGPPVQVGEPICLNGPGPHNLSFCKPGNNTNEYSIQAISEPSVGPGQALSDGCTKYLTVSGFDNSTLTWQSIAPDNPGDHNYLLSCTAQCDTTYVNWAASAPPYVDYLVCGYPLGGCDSNLVCDTVRVEFVSTLQVAIAPTNPTICYGQSATNLSAMPMGGLPPYSFSWNTGSTNQNISAGVGTFSVQLTDSTGCQTVMDSVTVTQFNLPITIYGGPDLNVCLNELPIQLNAQYQAASGIIWSGGSGTFSSSTDPNAIYTPSNTDILQGDIELFLETTGNGTCPPAYDTILIKFNDFTANIFLNTSNISCYGSNDGAATVAVNGNNGPYELMWNNDPNLTQSSLNGLSPGSYSIQITNTHGCDTILQFAITEPAPLVIDLMNTQNVSCFGLSNGSLDFGFSGGTGPFDYFLDGVLMPSFTFFSGLNGGNHLLQIIDSEGCSIDTMFQIIEPAQITSSITSPDSICPGQAAVIDLEVLGGNGPYTYQWSTNASSQDIVVSPINNTIYDVAITDQNGCMHYDTVEISTFILDQNALTLTSNQAFLCLGDTANIEASYLGTIHPPFIYSWSHCTTCAGAGPYAVSSSISQFYSVTITDGCGHQIHDSIYLEVKQLPVISVPDTLAIGCIDLEVDFTLPNADSLTNITWIVDGLGFLYGDHFLATITNAGTYPVVIQVEDVFGCKNQANDVDIIAHPVPMADFYTNRTTTDMYDPKIKFFNTSYGATMFDWSFGDGNFSNAVDPHHTYTMEGDYEVILTATNAHGCSDTASTMINIKPVVNVFIPNAFTPDGDGINDEFGVVGEGLIDQGFELLIFDRWGEHIFSGYSLSDKWNGAKGSSDEKTDLYVYKVKVSDILGHHHVFTGHVTVLR